MCGRARAWCWSGRTAPARRPCCARSPACCRPWQVDVQLGANVRLGYMAQEQENLDPSLDAYTSIRKLAPFSETDARAFLHQFLFSGDDVFIPAGRLSYGERARLLLACLVAQGCNLLLLDEPINHLDIPSRVRFEQALTNFEGTALVVSHDRYFIEGYASEIWEITPVARRVAAALHHSSLGGVSATARSG